MDKSMDKSAFHSFRARCRVVHGAADQDRERRDYIGRELAVLSVADFVCIWLAPIGKRRGIRGRAA